MKVNATAYRRTRVFLGLSITFIPSTRICRFQREDPVPIPGTNLKLSSDVPNVECRKWNKKTNVSSSSSASAETPIYANVSLYGRTSYSSCRCCILRINSNAIINIITMMILLLVQIKNKGKILLSLIMT
uniref:Uncharacterized protein n=1 Tax=Glossina pallidipes TaxID=7398 RepID=A0A1A9ZL09_GLOPL